MSRIIIGGNSSIGRAIKGKHIGATKCDVTKRTEVIDVIARIKPDEIVNCAGVIVPASITVARPARELGVNLLGSFNVASIGAFLGSKMVFIGSTSGLHGRRGWSVYCASKAGVISLVQTLALEGHQAWCVSPGRTKTKMRKDLFPGEDQSTLLDPKEVAKVVEDCFAGKYPSGSNIIVRKDAEIEVQN